MFDMSLWNFTSQAVGNWFHEDTIDPARPASNDRSEKLEQKSLEDGNLTDGYCWKPKRRSRLFVVMWNLTLQMDGFRLVQFAFTREYGRSRWTMADRPTEICQILPTRQTQSPISLRVASYLVSPQVSQFRFHSIAKPRFARTCAPANRKWNFHLDRGSSRDLHVHDHRTGAEEEPWIFRFHLSKTVSARQIRWWWRRMQFLQTFLNRLMFISVRALVLRYWTSRRRSMRTTRRTWFAYKSWVNGACHRPISSWRWR